MNWSPSNGSPGQSNFVTDERSIEDWRLQIGDLRIADCGLPIDELTADWRLARRAVLSSGPIGDSTSPTISSRQFNRQFPAIHIGNRQSPVRESAVSSRQSAEQISSGTGRPYPAGDRLVRLWGEHPGGASRASPHD